MRVRACILLWVTCTGGCASETPTIGTAGGKIVSSDGQAVLEVPAGALSAETPITMTAVTAPAGAVSAIAYDIGPTGLVFNKQVSLSISYSSANLSGIEEEGWLRIGVLTNGAWEAVVGCNVELLERRVTASLDHLSTYAVIPSKACVAGCTPTFVTLAAGAFQMGSPTGEPCREATETQHPVTLTRGFEIGDTEVTQEQFKSLLGYNPTSFRGCGPDCPVEYVSWHEAAAYCNALSARQGLAACYSCTGSQAAITCADATPYEGAKIATCPGFRLPTEAEWEYAYRAGSQAGLYNGSEASGQCPGCDPKVNDIGWNTCNSAAKTHAVRQKAPNAWKLYDLAGNVWEWTHDTFVADLGTSSVTDPVGPAALPERTIRGGFWGNCSCLLRAAARLSSPPTIHGNDHGFRCVRSK